MDAVLQNFRRSFGPSTPFFHSLSLDPLATMEELYKGADRYSTLEDNIRAVTQTVMITNQPSEKDKSVGKKLYVSNKGQNEDRKRPQDQSKKRREPPQFTPLNISYERLLPLIRDLPNFKWSVPIQTDPTQRNKSLRCNYHRDHGHETDRCRSLSSRKADQGRTPQEVPQGSRSGDQGVESGQPTCRITASLAAPLEPGPTINYILGGSVDDQYQSKH